jgi:hypothetical protein
MRKQFQAENLKGRNLLGVGGYIKTNLKKMKYEDVDWIRLLKIEICGGFS